MMRLVTDDDDTDLMPLTAEAPAVPDGWPAEVSMILSAMDMAERPDVDRRAAGRRSHRARADLRLYAHDPMNPPAELFTRDVSPMGLGFITRNPLPLGYNGLVRLTLADGEVVTASCSIYRCREAVGGWYEGALHFTQRQPDLG